MGNSDTSNNDGYNEKILFEHEDIMDQEIGMGEYTLSGGNGRWEGFVPIGINGDESFFGGMAEIHPRY